MPRYVMANRRRDLTNYMTEKSQSNLFIDQRTMVVVEMSLVQKKSGLAIAEELGMTGGQVSQILKKAREEYKMKSNIHIRYELNAELHKLDVIDREAWEAYFKSVGKKVKMVRRTDGAGAIIDATETVEDLAGDPRWLSIIHSNMSIRHKLIGLNQPEEIVIHNAESRLTGYIKEGKITFGALEDEYGREQAVKYFNLADAVVPDIIDGEIISDSDETED